MDGFKADPVELQICGSNLGNTSDELHTELRTLQRHMDDLLTSRWHGAAATGFGKGWRLWLHGANEVLDALGTMGRLLGDTGRDYQNTDASSTDTVRASGAGL